MIAITEMAGSRTWRSFTAGLGHTHTLTCQAAKATSISGQHMATKGKRKAVLGCCAAAAVCSTMSSSQQIDTCNSDYSDEMLFTLATPHIQHFQNRLTM